MEADAFTKRWGASTRNETANSRPHFLELRELHGDDARVQAVAPAAQAFAATRDRWLNPPELVERVPEVVRGFPDRIVPKNADAEAILRKRTLTAVYNTRGTPEGAWLDNLHRALDEAVAAAYGWPADLSDDEILARLLALNHERAAAQGAGQRQAAAFGG